MNRMWYNSAVLSLALLVPLLCAATYSWTANGADDDWDTCQNWVVVGIGGCWPNDSNDDAQVPYHAGGRDIRLITVNQIDDFTIQSSVDFTSATGNAETLYAESITIAGGTYGVTVTISGAEINVDGPDEP
ncbi:MAG: hypothetical protein CHACPFDD_03758 [Phycisphaerae bacterium]|nr:hypothetical protein [Phycisphaerae bacterium]